MPYYRVSHESLCGGDGVEGHGIVLHAAGLRAAGTFTCAHMHLNEPRPSARPSLQIYGIRYGLRGFYDRTSKPVLLTREVVEGIHLKGGTILVRTTQP